MPSPIIYFIAFTFFILSQYAIWVTSNLIAHHFGLVGKAYWCVVLVSFLLLNEFCFGAYDFSMSLIRDDDIYEEVE